MRRQNFALTVCLLLFAATGFVGLSSCGGGGGGKAPSSPGDQVIITPPANRAPRSYPNFPKHYATRNWTTNVRRLGHLLLRSRRTVPGLHCDVE